MRLLAISLAFLLPLCAQDQGKKRQLPAPSNLKVLKVTTTPEVLQVMQTFTTGLGQRCNFCHVRGNYASDENPKKDVARRMIAMVDKINDGMNAATNANKVYVTCYTCHRGETEPKAAPEAKPAQ